MKKGMKIVVLALAVLMVFSVTSTAFAFSYSGSCTNYYDSNGSTTASYGQTLTDNNSHCYGSNTTTQTSNKTYYRSTIMVDGNSIVGDGVKQYSGGTYSQSTTRSGTVRLRVGLNSNWTSYRRIFVQGSCY